jgi:CDP-diacylglycerol pyrophosphatase
MMRTLALLACAAAAAVWADPPPAPAVRDRLRFIVQEQCVPHWRAAHDPAPCVDVETGFAVLADRKGGAHFLLIPTQTIRGVESPEARAPGTPNFFDAAWQSRAVLAGVVGHAVPRAAVGLAVNHIGARSQDQLHIHISCVREGVAHELQAHAEALSPRWSELEIEGTRYQARRIMGERPGAANPFELVADTLPGAAGSMERFTLLLSGMDFAAGPGFVLLAGSGVPGAELMLDPQCVLAVGGTN